MKEAIIKFEPFVFKQTVFIKDDETGEVVQEHIPQAELTNYLSLKEDLHKIHFFGNAKFAQKIKAECVTKYKLDKVEILINE